MHGYYPPRSPAWFRFCDFLIWYASHIHYVVWSLSKGARIMNVLESGKMPKCECVNNLNNFSVNGQDLTHPLQTLYTAVSRFGEQKACRCNVTTKKVSASLSAHVGCISFASPQTIFTYSYRLFRPTSLPSTGHPSIPAAWGRTLDKVCVQCEVYVRWQVVLNWNVI